MGPPPQGPLGPSPPLFSPISLDLLILRLCKRPPSLPYDWVGYSYEDTPSPPQMLPSHHESHPIHRSKPSSHEPSHQSYPIMSHILEPHPLPKVPPR